MLSIIRPIIYVLLLGLYSALWAQSTSVEVVDSRSGQRYVLGAFSDGQLSLKVKGEPVETAIDVDNAPANQQLLLTGDDQLARGRAQAQAGDYAAAAEALKGYVASVLRYVSVPETLMPKEALYREYLTYLIQADQLLQAEEFVAQIPIGKASEATQSTALNYARALAEGGRAWKAWSLLDKLPLTRGASADIERQALDVGTVILAQGDTGEAQRVFALLNGSTYKDIQTEAYLWLVYANIEEGKLETAALLVEDVADTPRSAPAFSLVKLIRGKLLMAEGRADQALAHLSEGVTFGRLGAAWTPELYYLNGKAYLEAGYADASRKVFSELGIFYPESVWAQRAREALDTPQS